MICYFWLRGDLNDIIDVEWTNLFFIPMQGILDAVAYGRNLKREKDQD
jgi:hypothetical protein